MKTSAALLIFAGLGLASNASAALSLNFDSALITPGTTGTFAIDGTFNTTGVGSSGLGYNFTVPSGSGTTSPSDVTSIFALIDSSSITGTVLVNTLPSFEASALQLTFNYDPGFSGPLPYLQVTIHGGTPVNLGDLITLNLSGSFDVTLMFASGGDATPALFNDQFGTLTVTATPIPEPGTYALGAGLFGLTCAMALRRHRSSPSV